MHNERETREHSKKEEGDFYCRQWKKTKEGYEEEEVRDDEVGGGGFPVDKHNKCYN